MRTRHKLLIKSITYNNVSNANSPRFPRSLILLVSRFHPSILINRNTWVSSCLTFETDTWINNEKVLNYVNVFLIVYNNINLSSLTYEQIETHPNEIFQYNMQVNQKGARDFETSEFSGTSVLFCIIHVGKLAEPDP